MLQDFKEGCYSIHSFIHLKQVFDGDLLYVWHCVRFWGYIREKMDGILILMEFMLEKHFLPAKLQYSATLLFSDFHPYSIL